VFCGVHLWCVVIFAAICFVDGILVTLVLVSSVYGLPEDCVVYISSYS
jgi:hypothetical protein